MASYPVHKDGQEEELSLSLLATVLGFALYGSRTIITVST